MKKTAKFLEETSQSCISKRKRTTQLTVIKDQKRSEMIETSTIQAVLKEHPREEHDDDDSFLSYLIQILQDEDSYEDVDALVETLSPFWGDRSQEVQQLVDQLHPISRTNDTATTVARPLQRSVVVNANEEEPELHPTETTETTPPVSEESTPKKKKERRQRKTKKKAKISTRNQSEQAEEELLEDQASAWQDCQTQGVHWGGRGRGGRGEYAGAVNSVRSNIHLSSVNISLSNGTDLLVDATMDVVKGHRYGLIGRNGVGKSTLLRRLAEKQIPGMPADMLILLVQQQVQGSQKESAVEVLVKADQDRAALLREQEQIEAQFEKTGLTDKDLATAAERLGEIAGEWDAIGADTAEERAVEILKGLQFTDDMIKEPTSNLSGGWRMRLALARALFVQSDLLLFDECTNHLDLYGLNWLIHYLNSQDRTLIVVSHDRAFLDAICTDIVVMSHQKLGYHVGNYSEYDRQQREKAAREAQILDAAERQRTKAQAFIQKQQSQSTKRSGDPNKQRQARMMREKKLDRIGNYREDGKRYKLKSLKKLSEDSLRLAQKVQIEVDEPAVKMSFPDPTWPPVIGPHETLVRLEDFVFGYEGREEPLLDHVTLSLCRGSKVALVGRNGCGKTTLIRLITGELNRNRKGSGSLWVHPSLRIGHVSQYSVEEMEVYAEQTVLEYAEKHLQTKKATARVAGMASGNIRQYLGAFGLGGRHALREIGKLSGGERMRLCFATVLADEPHVLVLDESTNHVDMETLESMSNALNNFQGSVLMVSHNQGFLSGFCRELWVLERGHVDVMHSDTETFDEIFSEYRNSVLAGGDQSLSSRRREKTDRAKRALKQRSGAKQTTALL